MVFRLSGHVVALIQTISYHRPLEERISCAHTRGNNQLELQQAELILNGNTPHMCKLADTDAQHAPRSGGDVAAVPGESESSKSHRPIRPNHQPPSAELESAYTRKAPQGSSFLPPGPGSHRVRFRGPCDQEVLGYDAEGEGVSPHSSSSLQSSMHPCLHFFWQIWFWSG